jgi:hypothetical protein
MKRGCALRRVLSVGWLGFALCFVAVAQQRSVTGEYRNDAMGFAVRIPDKMRGQAGDQAGPERGVGISLPSGGQVTVYGEPNSFGYKTTEEGIRHSLSEYCDSDKPSISVARVGKLQGAKGRLMCGERVIEEMLAFRPGGGPIYWLTLQTGSVHAVEDEAALGRIAQGFKLIAWR